MKKIVLRARRFGLRFPLTRARSLTASACYAQLQGGPAGAARIFDLADGPRAAIRTRGLAIGGAPLARTPQRLSGPRDRCHTSASPGMRDGLPAETSRGAHSRNDRRLDARNIHASVGPFADDGKVVETCRSGFQAHSSRSGFGDHVTLCRVCVRAPVLRLEPGFPDCAGRRMEHAVVEPGSADRLAARGEPRRFAKKRASVRRRRRRRDSALFASGPQV